MLNHLSALNYGTLLYYTINVLEFQVWTVQGSDLRPLRCERSALPLSQPSKIASYLYIYYNGYIIICKSLNSILILN